MNKVVLTLFLITYSTQVFSATNPSRWRFEVNYGNVTTSYKETQDTPLFDDVNIEQKSEMTEVMFQYFLLPPHIDLAFGLQSAGQNIKTPTDVAQQFHYLNGYANVGWHLPSFNDFWSLKLVFEAYFTTLLVQDDAFGFRDLWGAQIYPEVEFLPFGTDLYTQISPFLKLPLYTKDDQRKETTIGLKIKLPFGNEQTAKFPLFAYQKAIMIRVFYSKVDLLFQKPGFIPSNITVEQTGVSIGFNW